MRNQSSSRARPALVLSLLAPFSLFATSGCDSDDGGPAAPAYELSAIIDSCDAGNGIAPAEVTCVGDFGGFDDAEQKPQVTFGWTFGDEAEGDQPLSGKRPTHLYTEPDDYTITLTVTLLEGGETAEATHEVSIKGAANLIVSHVAFDPAEVIGRASRARARHGRRAT